MPSLESENEIREADQSAMGKTEACAAVRDIYARLQVEIDHQKPICVASGKCCHFEAYGHRLYVTTLEMAAFMADFSAPGHPGERWSEGHSGSDASSVNRSHPLQMYGSTELAEVREREPEGCPFQKGKLCGAHAIRPFGCRIFFCDPTAADWQQQQYELFHWELKQLHDQFAVPYFYLEWRAALAAIGPTRQ